MSEIANGSEGAFGLINQGLISNYERTMGSAGKDAFLGKVIPLAQQILADKPDIYQKTLRALITAAPRHNTQSAMASLWESEINQDTFNFQRDFERLREPSNETIEPYVFHINHRKLLETEISDGMLIPKYKREGREFDPEDAEEESNDYYVYFASGTIDELSKFLAGYALVSKAWNWDASDFKRINSPQFPRTVALAIATTNDTRPNPYGGHDMMTLYSPEGNGELVDLYVSNRPVPVKIAKIPITVLTPEQVMELREEGKQFYRSGQFSGENIWFDIKDNENGAADIYASSKHQELAVKYTLLKLKENPELLTSNS